MTAEPRRVFFALSPSDAERDRLLDATRAMRTQIGGRAVPRQNLHLTLAFLGGIDSDRLDDLREIAAAAARSGAAAVGVTLDHLQYWARSQLVCAVPSQDPLEVRNLATPLATRLGAGGFPTDARRFRPHVTIARDVLARTATQDLAPVRWNFDSFSLVESMPGGSYRVLNRWAFTFTAG